MNLGFMEIMLISIVALVVLGPDKLPEFAHKLGAGLKEFKKATNDLTSDLKENIVEPLNEVAKPITDLEKDVKDSLKDVTKSINDIGKE